MIQKYFDVTPVSPLEDFEREVVRHPVFQVNTGLADQAEKKLLELSERK
jgi:hypothetical protein